MPDPLVDGRLRELEAQVKALSSRRRTTYAELDQPTLILPFTSDTIRPQADAVDDIGTASLQYASLFLATALEGTSIIQIENIADGLITDAKLAEVESESFTATGTGFDGADPTGTAYVDRRGNLVTLHLPSLSGTSDSTAFTIPGLPAAYHPTRRQRVVPVTQDNGSFSIALLSVETTGVINMFSSLTSSTFTASGTKSNGNDFAHAYSLQ